MKARTLCLMGLGLVGASSAWAGNDFSLAVRLGADGKTTACSLDAMVSEEAGDQVKVSVTDARGIAKAPSQTLTVRVHGEAGQADAKLDLDTNTTNAATDRGAYANRKLSLMDAAGVVLTDADGKKCEMLLAPPLASKAESPSPALSNNLSANRLNQQALAYLAVQKIAGHAFSGGAHGKQYRLYHLPDGTPAFPLPAHISEEDHVEIWLVLPVGAKATVDVVACEKASGFRVRGSYKDALELAGKLQERHEPEFVLTAYGNPLQCAGTLTYKIATAGAGADGDTTTSVAIDPVYRFEWGVGYGFDFGRPRRLSLADRQPVTGTGTDKVVVDSRDFTGAKPIITLLVDVCGTNPSAMDWCDRLLNPTIWLDPTRLDKGFGVGLTLRPLFGVGILVGLSLFKSTEFGDGVAANPGDTWSTAGALPTKEVFNRQSLGLMLAATLDVEILSKLLQ